MSRFRFREEADRKRWADALAAKDAEIDRLRAALDEQTAIVARIWVLLGSPTYEQLAGRSIYDLIGAMTADYANTGQFQDGPAHPSPKGEAPQ